MSASQPQALSEKSIRLERVAEYLVFTALPVSLYTQTKPSGATPEAAPRRPPVELRFVDTDETSITVEAYAQVDAEALTLLAPETECLIHAPFRGQLLSFESKILSRVEKHAHRVRISKPKRAQIHDSRSQPRVSLLRPELKSELKFELTLTTRSELDVKEFTTSNLNDLSAHYLGCTLSRKQGLLLPDDVIQNLTLTSNGHPVLSTTGRIARIDPSRGKSADRSQYYCLVELNKESCTDGNHGVVRIGSASEQRKTGRTFLDSIEATLDAPYPFSWGATLRGKIIDLSTSGCSILFRGESRPIPAGTVLSQVQIQLPHRPPIKTRIKIISSRIETDATSFTVRASAAFLEQSDQQLKLLTEVIQTSANKNVVDATLDDYEQVWEFFFESGFIYHDKRNQLQSLAPVLLKTYRSLLHANNSVVKTILFKEQDQIKGHISAVRFFDSTWLIQHLNALKSSEGASLGYTLVKGFVDFFVDFHAQRLNSTAFVACYFRPDNPYPAILFGESKNLIANASICNTVELLYCTLRSDPFPSFEAKTDRFELATREATPDDLAELEAVLLEQKRYDLIKIENLRQETMTSLKVKEEYSKIGLYRHRRIFVCTEKKSARRAYAICNYASPGLNLSELTNSFRFILQDPLFQHNVNLTSCLAEAVLESYQATEMPYPALLSDSQQIIPFQFEFKKTYTYWYLDIRYVPLFHEKIRFLQDNLKEYLKKHRGRDSAEK